MPFLQFPLSDYEMNQISTIEQHLSQSNGVFVLSDGEVSACHDAIETMKQRGILIDLGADNANIYRLKGSFAEFKKWIQFQNNTAKKQTERVGWSYMTSEPLTINCEILLKEILEHRDPAGNCDLEYWKQRFEGLNFSEDSLLRSQFGILRNRDMINVMWADNIPYFLTVLELGLSYFEQRNGAFNQTVTMPNTKFEGEKEYDVFISHASKDKLGIVDELYNSLKKLGINIFYDKETILWGDNWKQSILDAVKKSQYAIVVISENFFGREWTERELNEFLRRQNESGQKIVMPLLYNVTAAQMIAHYPMLNDLQAQEITNESVDNISLMLAKELISRLKQNDY